MYSQDKDLLVVTTESIPGQVCCKREKKKNMTKMGKASQNRENLYTLKKVYCFVCDYNNQ